MFQFKIGIWLEWAMKFSKKKIFFKKTFLWTRRMQFWQTSRNIVDQKIRKIWLQVRKRLERNLFLWKYFYLFKRSSGLIESSCDRPSEMFLLEVRNQQIRSSNLTKMFSKMFFLTRQKQFLERSRKFFVNVRAFFAQSLKKIKEFSSLQGFFQKNSYELVERKIGNPEEVSSTEAFNVSIQSPKVKKKSFQVSQKLLFLKKTFLWTRRMQFGQPTRIFLIWGPGIFSCSTKKHGKNIFLEEDNLFLSKGCSGFMKSSLDKPFRMFLLKSLNWQIRFLNLEKKVPKVCFWTVFMQSRERTRNVLPFSENFCVKVWWRKKNQLFCKNHCFSQIVHLSSLNKYFSTLPQFLPKVQKRFAQTPKKSKKTLVLEIKIFFQDNPQRS